jgi:hypothetical protein
MPRRAPRAALVRVVLAAAAVGAPFTATTGARAESTICVGVVVDYGDATGAPSGPRGTCVEVSPGSTGADVLAKRASQLGTMRPRYNSSGLLCAIDGYPESGCAERTSDDYEYWSYWHRPPGGGAWQYARVGPGSYEVHDGEVEGWRFQSGNGTRSDPAPRSSVTFTQLCPDEASPTPRPSRPPTTAPARPTTTPPATSPGPAGQTSRPTAGAPQPTDRSSDSSTSGVSPTTAASATSAGTPGTAGPSASTSIPATIIDTAGGPPRRGSDVPWGTIGGGVAVAALLGVTFWRARRGP